MSKKALLIICDGWGIGDKGKDDVIFNTPTPYWDELLKTYPASQLQASGENVGLPDGQMGNSEVGQFRSRSPQYRCRTYRLSRFGEDQHRLPREYDHGEPGDQTCL